MEAQASSKPIGRDGPKPIGQQRTAGSLHRLTDRQCKALAAGGINGWHADGGGLQLRIGDGYPRWIFRWTADGRTSYATLGRYPDRSLAWVRDRAKDCRNWIAEGRDPRIELQRETVAQGEQDRAVLLATGRQALTLERAVRDYHKAHAGELTEKHGAQWLRQMELHVFPKLGAHVLAQVKAKDVLAVLQPLKAQVPETAARLRQRLDAVFEHALLHELADTNPAAACRRALRSKTRRVVEHHAAMAYADVPAFIRKLRGSDNGLIARAALEFLVLTAARTAEVIGATWREIDTKAKAWTIPAARMKASAPHTVYLSAPALAIVRQMRGFDDDLVFPSPQRAGRPLSNMVFLAALKRMGLWGPGAPSRVTAHGFRASFSTWANEQHYPRDVIEASLAHRESDAVRAAYNRAAYVEQRRALADTWGAFCAGKRESRAAK